MPANHDERLRARPGARIALFGRPGAGKSTVSRLLREQAAARTLDVLVIKLGAPLYELQQLIYSTAGAPMLDPSRQDGRLLNDLGSHLRRIDPEALTRPFRSRVERAGLEAPKALVVCDDVRAPDAAVVRELGFALVEIVADERLRRTRKALRADLTAGSDAHETEAPVTAGPDLRIANNGSLDELRGRVEGLFR